LQPFTLFSARRSDGSEESFKVQSDSFSILYFECDALHSALLSASGFFCLIVFRRSCTLVFPEKSTKIKYVAGASCGMIRALAFPATTLWPFHLSFSPTSLKTNPLTDPLKFDSEENRPRLPEEDATDSFFAMLEQDAGHAFRSIDAAGSMDVIPASDIRVTLPRLLELDSGNGATPPSGGQIDWIAEPPVQVRAIVLRPVPPKPPGIHWQIPLLLYLVTWYSVTMAGKQAWESTASGLLFALGVMTILTCHELGHFIQTRRYRIRSSLPYFIPMPIPGAIFGTMGAIIKMDGRIPNRRVLFDIGISGPLAGLVPTLIFCVIGVQQAQVAPIVGDSLQFGDPLLFQWLSHYVFGPIPDEMTLCINPIGLAGWFGLFLTSLNLFPLGQLDGGHVFYAILGKRAPTLSVIFYTLIVACVIFAQAFIWLVMLVLIYLMNPRHPPTQNDEPPIGLFRTVLGIATLAFIIIGFTVNPITITTPDPHEMELLTWLAGF